MSNCAACTIALASLRADTVTFWRLRRGLRCSSAHLGSCAGETALATDVFGDSLIFNLSALASRFDLASSEALNLGFVNIHFCTNSSIEEETLSREVGEAPAECKKHRKARRTKECKSTKGMRDKAIVAGFAGDVGNGLNTRTIRRDNQERKG